MKLGICTERFVPPLSVAEDKDVITTCMHIILVASMLYVFYVTKKANVRHNLPLTQQTATFFHCPAT